jgi:expansin
VIGGGGSRRRRARTRWAAPLGVVGAALAGAGCLAVLIVTGTDGHGSACAAARPVFGLAAAEDAVTTGEATNYTLATDQIGNCSLIPPPDGLYVALSPAEYADGTRCGGYLRVTGPSGTVLVKIIDQCPPCAAGHIDLSRTAFAQIGQLSQGIIPVSYRTVVDPVLPGPLTFQVKEGSSQYWLAIRVDDEGNALTGVRAASAGGSAQNLVQTDYNYWIAQSGLGPGPFSITLTDDVGHTVEVSGIRLDPEVVQQTSVWMYGAGGTGSTSAPAVPTGSNSASARTVPSRPAPAVKPAAAAASAARSGSATADSSTRGTGRIIDPSCGSSP